MSLSTRTASTGMTSSTTSSIGPTPPGTAAAGPPSASRRRVLQGSLMAGAVTIAGFDVADALPRPPRKKPNVILISIDDLNWNGLGCYGNEYHETPHIDRIAAKGMRFTQAYAAAPVCSPSRAALVTGLYPARTGITNFLHDEPAPSNLYLSTKFRSLPEQIATRGYRSGLMGKWHLTEDYSGPYRKRKGNPYAHGFDSVELSEERYYGWGDWFYPYRFMPSVRGGKPREYLTDRISRDLDAWVRRHRRKPFFLHVSNYAVHHKWKARAALVRKYRKKKRKDPKFHNSGCKPEIAAMVERLDEQVGSLVRTLERAGIAENTLILITSDNGGQVNRANRPLRDGKGSVCEGGIRVPLIAYWPGTVAADSRCDDPVSHIDLVPTVSSLAGAGGGGRFDGVSLDGVLSGGTLASRELYWYYPHHMRGNPPSAAVRDGRYKLIKRLRTGRIELYDLERDVREKRNLAKQEKDVARRLHRKLKRHLKDVRRVPEPPDRYSEVATRVDLGEPEQLAEHEGMLITGSAKAEVIEGRGRVAADGEARMLLRSRRAPDESEVALVLDPRLSAARPAAERPSVGIGLIRDAHTYLTLDYDDARRTVGWSLVVDGRPQTYEPAEPLDDLDGTVDLSAPDARLGLSMRDGTVAAYADQGRGAGWEFLFLLDVGGVLDLSDAGQRARWRYGVRVDLAGGSVPLGGYTVRRTVR